MLIFALRWCKSSAILTFNTCKVGVNCQRCWREVCLFFSRGHQRSDHLSSQPRLGTGERKWRSLSALWKSQQRYRVVIKDTWAARESTLSWHCVRKAWKVSLWKYWQEAFCGHKIATFGRPTTLGYDTPVCRSHLAGVWKLRPIRRGQHFPASWLLSDICGTFSKQRPFKVFPIICWCRVLLDLSIRNNVTSFSCGIIKVPVYWLCIDVWSSLSHCRWHSGEIFRRKQRRCDMGSIRRFFSSGCPPTGRGTVFHVL